MFFIHHPNYLFSPVILKFIQSPLTTSTIPLRGSPHASWVRAPSNLNPTVYQTESQKEGPLLGNLEKVPSVRAGTRGPPIHPSQSRPTKLHNPPKTSGQTFESRACQRHPPSANCRQYLVCGVTHPCVGERPHLRIGPEISRVAPPHYFLSLIHI